MSGHSKGPWVATKNSWQYTTIYDAGGKTVCTLDLEDWGVTEENQDELESQQAEVARLIASAHDLLAALTDMLREFDDPSVTDEIMTQIGMSANTVKALQRARATIAKATGAA